MEFTLKDKCDKKCNGNKIAKDMIKEAKGKKTPAKPTPKKPK